MSSRIFSWTANEKVWGIAFLSWNKERPDLYASSAHKLRDSLKKKGMRLIIDQDFNPSLLEDKDGWSFNLVKHCFVFLSRDYVSSTRCVNEYVLIAQSGLSSSPLFFYAQDENQEEDWYESRKNQYCSLAVNTTNVPHSTFLIDQAITSHFSSVYEHSNPSIPEFAGRSVSYLSRDILDYHTFRGLELCLQIVANIMILPLFEHEASQLMYIGIMGVNKTNNKLITEAFRSFPTLPSYSIKYLLLDDLSNNRFPKNLSKRQSLLAKLLFGKNTPPNSTDKYLLVIENPIDFSYIEALSSVIDLLNPASRIVFTTASYKFFDETGVSWSYKSYNDFDLYWINGKISTNRTV